MKKNNEGLKSQIESEVDKASKFMMGRNRDAGNLRDEYGDVNIKKQIKRLTWCVISWGFEPFIEGLIVPFSTLTFKS